MWKIAQKHGLPLESLIAANPQIQNPNVLEVGMKVKVPTANAAAPKQTPGTAVSPSANKAKQMPAAPGTAVSPTADKAKQMPAAPKAQPKAVEMAPTPVQPAPAPAPKMELPKMQMPQLPKAQAPQMQTMPQIQAAPYCAPVPHCPPMHPQMHPQMMQPMFMPYCPPLAPKPLPQAFHTQFPTMMPQPLPAIGGQHQGPMSDCLPCEGYHAPFQPPYPGFPVQQGMFPPQMMAPFGMPYQPYGHPFPGVVAPSIYDHDEDDNDC